MPFILMLCFGIAAAISAIVGISESSVKWIGIGTLLVAIDICILVGERIAR